MNMVEFEEFYGNLAAARDHARAVAKSTRKQDDKDRINALADVFESLVNDLDEGIINPDKVSQIVPATGHALQLVEANRIGPRSGHEVWITRNEQESQQIQYAHWITKRLLSLRETLHPVFGVLS